MDQENLPCGPRPMGMYASDQEEKDLFERVWKRVMPEDRPDCPIVTAPCPAAGTEEEVHTAPDGPAPEPEAPPVPDLPEEPGPELPPEPEAAERLERVAPGEPERPAQPEGRTDTRDDFPERDAVPCLGSGSAGHGSQLQEDILDALEGWQLYRHLARRVTGSAARSLSALASEKHRQARRLAAAYFLISGVRYWPTDRLAVPRTASWLGTLRRRFSREQQVESRFRAEALDTEDPCLADLYRELADGCADFAAALRALLEAAL